MSKPPPWAKSPLGWAEWRARSLPKEARKPTLRCEQCSTWFRRDILAPSGSRCEKVANSSSKTSGAKDLPRWSTRPLRGSSGPARTPQEKDFAVLALLLATIGIYGVISLALQQRMHELGVRIALGAQDTDVLRLMIGYGMRPIVVGIGIGVVLAIGLTRFMQTLLFEVQPTDPLTYATVIVVLGTAGAAACYMPARRAMRVDPVEALRAE